MDQHFMVDDAVIHRIVSAVSPQEGETILEIGPGRGELTRFLSKASVVAIELDRKLASSLEGRYSGVPGVRIIRGNALKLLKGLRFDRIVSNLPYSICEPLFRELPFVRFKEAFFAIPKGFSSLLLKPPYSGLFETELLFDIPKAAFSPRPRTFSVFVRVVPADGMMRAVFISRTSMLKNAVMKALSTRKKMTKNHARQALKDMHLSIIQEKRVCDLVPEDFSLLEKRLERFK